LDDLTKQPWKFKSHMFVKRAFGKVCCKFAASVVELLSRIFGNANQMHA
jgi:hypothetical protein